jgi:hypothetical protein
LRTTIAEKILTDKIVANIVKAKSGVFVTPYCEENVDVGINKIFWLSIKLKLDKNCPMIDSADNKRIILQPRQ